MVLQREKEIPFWGKAVPNSKVNILFANSKKVVIANKDSVWRVSFKPQKANINPQGALFINGLDTLKISDILIGDVWLCAGQSNMAFMLKNDQFARQTLPNAANKNLRLLNLQSGLSVYNVPYKANQISQLQPENFYKGTWQVSDSASARDFSAVGYFYGKMLQESTQIPIGLINVAIGGTPTEAWMSAEAGNENPETAKVFQGDWLNNKTVEPWCIERGHQNLDELKKNNALLPEDELGINHPFKPTFLYKAAIEPLLDFPIKGVIWYQGESNALSLERTQQHEILFPLMVKDWRKKWNQGNFPFYFCQLSSIGTEKGYKSQYWPEFRASQMRMSESIPNSGIAITSDYGLAADVHPTNKKIVGERLAKVALAKTYRKPIVSDGPKLLKVIKKPNQIILKFDQKLFTKNNDELVKFELVSTRNNDKVEVVGKIIEKEVIIDILGKNQFSKILYGWQPYQHIIITGKSGIPVSSFASAL